MFGGGVGFLSLIYKSHLDIFHISTLYHILRFSLFFFFNPEEYLLCELLQTNDIFWVNQLFFFLISDAFSSPASSVCSGVEECFCTLSAFTHQMMFKLEWQQPKLQFELTAIY